MAAPRRRVTRGGRFANDLVLRYLVVLGAFSALTILWLLPLVAHLGSAVSDSPSDATSTMRDYWAMERQGGTPFTLEHDALLNAPEGTDLAPAILIANGIQPAFVWATKGAIGVVAALNLFMLAGFALAGLCAFVLLDRVGMHPLASAFGSYVFAFNPYMFSKLAAGHAGLVQTWIFPLLAYLLVELHRRRTWLAAALVGLATGVAFYLHSYYGFFALVLVGVFVAVDLVRAPSRRERLRSLVLGATGLGVTLVTLVPALVATLRDPGSVTATAHSIDDLQQFGARVGAYLLPAQSNPLLGGLVGEDTRRALAQSEPTLFLGYTTMVLALVGLVLLVRRHSTFAEPARRYLGIAAVVLVPVAFVMSLPRIYHGVPMPAYLIGTVTTTIRVFARFGVLVELGLLVLAAFALDALLRSTRSRRRRLVPAALALCVVGVEFAHQVPAPIWRTDRPPALVGWLAEQPRGIVAIYPSPGDEDVEARFLREQYFFQTLHAQPLFFSGSPKKGRAWAIRELVDELDEPNVPQLLAAESVRYIVVNDAIYRAKGELPPGVPQPLLASFGDIRVFDVVAEPADLEATLHDQAARIAAAMGIPVPTTRIPGDGFHDPERGALDGRDWRWLVQSGVVEVDVPESRIPFELSGIAFSALRPRRLTLLDEEDRTLGEVDVGTSTQEIRLGPFELPSGKSRLRLTVSPPPEPLGQSDSRNASIFLSPVEIRPVADYSRR